HCKPIMKMLGSHTKLQLCALHNRTALSKDGTLVEVARTMLIFSKAPLFLWTEAVATASNDGEDLDEYFNPPPSVSSLVPTDAAPRHADSTVHLRQLSLIKLHPLIVLHQQYKKHNLQSFMKVLKNSYNQHHLMMIPFSTFLPQNQVLKNNHQLCNKPTHLLNTSANGQRLIL
ncbi:hypothetical protein Tco_0227476, partial [Tanacetum coccineum]